MARVHFNLGNLGEWARENYSKFEIADVQDDLEKEESDERVKAYFREFHDAMGRSLEECRGRGLEEKYMQAVEDGLVLAERVVADMIARDSKKRFDRYGLVVERMMTLADDEGNRLNRLARPFLGASHFLTPKNEEERILRSYQDVEKCIEAFAWEKNFAKNVLLPVFVHTRKGAWGECLVSALEGTVNERGKRCEGILYELAVAPAYLKNVWIGHKG